MKQTRFVEFDKISGQLVVNLPSDSEELRATVMERIHDFLHSYHVNEKTLDDLETMVTHTLLENSIKVD